LPLSDADTEAGCWGQLGTGSHGQDQIGVRAGDDVIEQRFVPI
jgi:hypothetical protein